MVDIGQLWLISATGPRSRPHGVSERLNWRLKPKGRQAPCSFHNRGFLLAEQAIPESIWRIAAVSGQAGA